MNFSKMHNDLDEKSKREIKDVFEKICQAFASSDLDLALSYFSDQGNMVKISSGHVFRGKKELSEYWHLHLGNQESLQISVDQIEMHKIDDRHVWTIAEELIVMGEQQIKAVVSNIFVFTGSGWKILLDHTTPIQQ